MKKFVVLVSVFALAACNATPQDQESDIRQVQVSLPEGCSLNYAGEVRVAGRNDARPSRIFYVKCGNIVTTSETHSVSNGKTTVDQNNVTVVTQ